MSARPDERQRPGNRVRTVVLALEGDRRQDRTDYLATEEPLELRLKLGQRTQRLAVTMRTPGADFELAAGFLLAEGVVTDRGQILGIHYCAEVERAEQLYNVVTVELDASLTPDLRLLERPFLSSSACGVCGKASLESLELRGCATLPLGAALQHDVLFQLPERMRQAQGIFRSTGGLHAAGLFDREGKLIQLREDVGRHNALDKLLGWALLQDRLPLQECLVLVSGRASFELVQKCLVAGVPILCAVSAPSSLAVELAEAYGMTLVGFLRERRCNIYTGARRIMAAPAQP